MASPVRVKRERIAGQIQNASIDLVTEKALESKKELEKQSEDLCHFASIFPYFLQLFM